MNTNMTMNLERYGILLGILAAVGCAESGRSGGGPALSEQALQCPDDYVAYDFGKSPIALDSEYYQAALGPDAGVPYVLPSGIKVTGIECWKRIDHPMENTYATYPTYEKPFDAKRAEQQKANAEKQCNGQAWCTIGSSDYCDIAYTCESDPNNVKHTGGPTASGGYWTGRVNWDKKPMPLLDCTQPAEEALRARRAARQTATACVPKNCRGKTHRGPNLDCIPDAEMEAFSLSAMKVTGPSKLTTEYNPELAEQGDRRQTLYSSASYQAWVGVDYGKVAPKQARLIYWMSDVYVPKTVDVPANANLDEIVAKHEVKEAFRCTALTLDVGRSADDDTATSVARKVSEQLSPECFKGQRVVENLAALTGQKQPLDTYKYLGTRLNRSLDIIGRNVFVPGAVDDAAVAKSCAPNPPEFYFDTATSSYDLVSYYKQRQVDSLFHANDEVKTLPSSLSSLFGFQTTSSGAVRDFGGKGSWVDVGANAPVLRIGPQEVRVGVAELQVTNSRSGTSELPVDVSWFLAHGTPEHLLDPNNVVWSEAQDDYVPATQPVMSFYLWPTDGAVGGDMPKIGELALDPKGSSPSGKTDTGTIALPGTVRAMFFNPSSPLHVSADKGMRSFELVGCLDARVDPGIVRPITSSQHVIPPTSTDSRFFASAQRLSLGIRSTGNADVVRLDKNGRPVVLNQGDRTRAFGGQENPLFQVAVGTGYPEQAFTPWKGWGPGPGCRVASMPIVVHALRLTYPVRPTSTQADDGTSSDTASGSNDMSAAQGTDTEANCNNADRSDCTEAGNSNMEGSGEMARSYYNSDSSLKRMPGDSVALDGTSEMLGMQLVDMADPMGDEQTLGWPEDPQAKPDGATPVTITVAPPWDEIVKALRKGRGKSPVDWSTGKYAGIMGLGMGIGFKVRLQIGPIPGLVTITISGGLATELVAELQFAPSEDDAYFCEGDADCVGIETEAKTFPDAVESCAKKGGRLAELETTAEANSVISSAKGGGGKYWLGGQLAYSYLDPQCARAFNRASCLPNATSSYRWLSNDVEFAYAKGEAGASYRSGKWNATAQRAFATTLPTNAGLLYDGATDTAQLAAQTDKHPYICRYTAANDYNFLRWSLASNLGVAAGIGVSFCVPSDEPGICLGGSLNVVAVHLSPTYEHKYYWLLDKSSRVYAMAGFTEFSIPWGVTLLEGSMWAQINVWLFSVQWNILEFEGFKLAEGQLIEPKNDQFRLKY